MTEKRKPIIIDLERDFPPFDYLAQSEKSIPTPEEALATAQEIAKKLGKEVRVVSARDVHPDLLIDDRIENLTGWPEHNMPKDNSDIGKILDTALKMREQASGNGHTNTQADVQNDNSHKPK
jgi:hypothetical protein